MIMHKPARLAAVSFLSLFGASFSLAANPEIKLTPNSPSGIYNPGEEIAWNVEVRNDEGHSIKDATYTLKNGSGKIIGKGELNMGKGTAFIRATANKPDTLLAEVRSGVEGQEEIVGLGGAVVAPDKIEPALPRPADFDAFWQAKIKELEAVPENAVLDKGESGVSNVDYWQVTMDNIRGTHIRGQLARPTTGSKFPGRIMFQWWGVYPLAKDLVTGPASQGWLCLNISAHDLPIDEPKEFYEEQARAALKDYHYIGADDREKAYYLRMLLACYRAVEYLSKRPDWDGRTIVLTGASQGSHQSLATAALNHKVTAVIACVPGGCNRPRHFLGKELPAGLPKEFEARRDKLIETARYFDLANFVPRIECPVLVSLGLIDTTCPPFDIFAAINRIKAPKEVVVMAGAGHFEVNNSHGPHRARTKAWCDALMSGQAAPARTDQASVVVHQRLGEIQ